MAPNLSFIKIKLPNSIKRNCHLTVERNLRYRIYSTLHVFYNVFPMVNGDRHCATPKRVTIGVKVCISTDYTMYNEQIISACLLKHFSKN